MKILIIEPFCSGSHKKWTYGYQQSSQHDVDILSLPGRHWKWRMHGGAISLAKQYKKLVYRPDLIIVSDMLDLATFAALTRKEIENIPLVLYFHENQITYPWSPTDQDVSLKRDNHYGFINYTSALSADQIFYNSQYHLNSFTQSLPSFLKQFPDHTELEQVELIKNKSEVLYLGMDLKYFDAFKHEEKNNCPVLLWNHRWEYDKNPNSFYEALHFLRAEQLDFQLIVLGESYHKSPAVFKQIKKDFEKELLHIGYAKDLATYAQWLWKADILPVTSHQDFFGGSVVEAIYCQCFPLLPERLAYSEHIAPAIRQQHFYHNQSDFYQKLKEAVLSFQKWPNNQQLANFVARYDWSILAEHYDLTFQNTVNEYQYV